MLCHLYITNKESFNFIILDKPKEIKGYYYIGSLDL